MRRWVAWNLFFRLQEYAKGHATFRILREMEAVDRMPAEALQRLQSEKLRDLIVYCHAHVPHVRAQMQAAGISPDDIRDTGALRHFPVLRKADVRKHRESLKSEIATDLSPFSTGGSTGEPLIFDVAKRRAASRVACRQRVSRWWGVSVGDPEIALWGSPVELTRQDRLRALRDKLFATQLLPAFEMNEEMMSSYLDILERRPCKQIFGYPSAIYQLCEHARKHGRNLAKVGVKAVFVTGEVLLPYHRETISKAFGCAVANGYGGRDSGFISHECPHGGMHVMADAVIVEILDSDGRPALPGEAGEIVVTDLYSHEAPFIRYATGDLAAWSNAICPCGRALPLLDRIEGRSNDSIVTPDGRVMNSLALIYAVREVDGIDQFRIRQKAASWFHVQVVRNERFQADAEDRIRRSWTQLLRSPADVTFEYVQAIPPEASGKFRHVISDIGLVRPQVSGV